MPPSNNRRAQQSAQFTWYSLLLSLLLCGLPVLSTAAPFWQGPYAGVYLGGGFGMNRASTDVGMLTETSYFTTQADVNAVNQSGSWRRNSNSLLAGALAGHDWVCQEFVFGLLFDFNVMQLISSKTFNDLAYPDNTSLFSITSTVKTDWLFTFRGRFGYAIPWHQPFLLYATGGMALTQLEVSNGFVDNSLLLGAGGSHASETQLGWTAGIGMELALACNVTVNVEYLYVGIPSTKTSNFIANTEGAISPLSLASPFSSTGQLPMQLFKISLNYRFDE